jgi:flagellar protein FliS
MSYSRGAHVAAYQSIATHGGVAASDPHRLIVMLMDGALDRIAHARGCIEHGNLVEKNRLLHRSIEILGELHASLDMAGGGGLAINLADLYDYMCSLLLKASLENRMDPLNEVTGLLHTLRDAWSEMPADQRIPGSKGAR